MNAQVLTHRGHDYTIHAFGTVYRNEERMTRAELLALPADGRVWRWLREHGAKRPRPSGQSGAESTRVRVLGGWRVDPATKARVRDAAAAAGTSESAWVERAIERACVEAAPDFLDEVVAERKAKNPAFGGMVDDAARRRNGGAT